MENGKCSMENAVWKMQYGKCSMENAVWKMQYGKCSMENAVWKMENAVWKMQYGKWKIQYASASPCLRVRQSSLVSMLPLGDCTAPLAPCNDVGGGSHDCTAPLAPCNDVGGGALCLHTPASFHAGCHSNRSVESPCSAPYKVGSVKSEA